MHDLSFWSAVRAATPHCPVSFYSLWFQSSQRTIAAGLPPSHSKEIDV